MSPVATLSSSMAQDAALRTADQLFYSKGVGAVTMAEIRDGSGVSLRRLYSMYPSKSDLVAGWLRYRHTVWMDGFQALVLESLEAGADPTDAAFVALEQWMVATDFRGCGFINTHAEVHELTDEHLLLIREHKAALADYLDELVPAGRAVAVVVDGAIVQASIFRSVEPIRLARTAARALSETDRS